MDVIRYNEKYYITKFYFSREKYNYLINNGALYIKQPSENFKISYSMYIPIELKQYLLENFNDFNNINIIDKNIIQYFYQGKKTYKAQKNSFYSYEDISGLYIYLSFQEMEDCRKLLALPIRTVSKTKVNQFKYKNNTNIRLYLEDYLFNTDIKKYLMDHTEIDEVFYDKNVNLSTIVILNRYFMFI